MARKMVAVGQFGGDVELLKIDVTTGEGYMVPISEVNKDKICFGMYESEKNEQRPEFVALLATPEGPLLFLKGLQYRPEIGKTQISVKDDGNYTHFQVLHDNQPIFGLFYERKFGIGLHPYSHGREDIDFYYWLSKRIGDPNLYRVYSKEVVYL